MDLSAAHDPARRRQLTVTGVIGIAYTLSWIAGLAVAAPSPRFTASGGEIVTALARHGAAVAAQFTLTVDAVSDLDLSYTPPLGSPWDAIQIGAQAWTRQVQPA